MLYEIEMDFAKTIKTLSQYINGVPVDIGITIVPNAKEALSAFYIPPATKTPFAVGSYVGDVAQGGSCNCEVLSFCPHGNGTHTEAISHLVSSYSEEFSVINLISQFETHLMPCMLLNVEPELLSSSNEPHEETWGSDMAITRHALERAAAEVKSKLNTLPEACRHLNWSHSLVLKTRQHTTSQKHPQFSGTNPPYLTPAAMAWVVEQGVRHLCVDLPSVDREDDGGRLLAHRVYWGVGGDARSQSDVSSGRVDCSITELCSPPPHLPAGLYALSLRIAPLALDAAPSTPLLFPLSF
eukprot:Colp12_sorted_trinity150504_noHs@403